jgi:aldehyde dehydrogenase (NAD+)
MEEVKAEVTGDVFDGKKAEAVVRSLRASFEAGKTKPYQWRVSQLEGIVRLIMERETEIMEALQSDLAKPNMETYLHEVSLFFFSALTCI